ncbi:TPA: riboflavin synthase [Streptococcus agalactiae]|nr:riboflavin synthase [Streptococcus agalactiae]HEN7078017.1 riboflavin synthase [Streptococcus agalactiae]HEN8913483.1 riboflavin synthase [Streptococcus agalactiae]
MFTGIIEEMGQVSRIRNGIKSQQLSIDAPKLVPLLRKGDSVAVNGVCLTVLDKSEKAFIADVMPESMMRTSLAALRLHSKVNLELALRSDSRLGGHFVLGHVDGVGKIEKIQKDDIAVRFSIDAPPSIMSYIIEKGSVALDGISLTVVSFTEHSFEVSVIPHTMTQTNLSLKKVGDLLNIEVDVLGKYAEKFLAPTNRTNHTSLVMDWSFLSENGY